MISNDLTWSTNSTAVVKKSQQHLLFLRRLRTAHLSPQIMLKTYRCTIESILTTCTSVWFGNRVEGYSTYRQCPALNNYRNPQQTLHVEDERHHEGPPLNPNHGLFALLPSGRCYKSLYCYTTRLRKSFIPSTVTLLNSIYYNCTFLHNCYSLHLLLLSINFRLTSSANTFI